MAKYPEDSWIIFGAVFGWVVATLGLWLFHQQWLPLSIQMMGEDYRLTMVLGFLIGFWVWRRLERK